MLGIKISSDGDRKEFIGQIIDVFEDFLEQHNVVIKNVEDTDAIIFGADYDSLSIKINNLINQWSEF